MTIRQKKAVKQRRHKKSWGGQNVKTRGERRPVSAGLVVGRYKGHRSGYGFVIPETEEADIFIGRGGANGAMQGDRVTARIERTKPDGKREGGIVQILERAHTHLVGKFEQGKDFGTIIPSDQRIIYDLHVTPPNSLSAKTGDAVLAEILSYPGKGRRPEGKVVKILGRLDDPKIDTEMVIASFDLPRYFPPAVISDSENVDAVVSAETRQRRIDLRRLPTVTVDGERARDYDDAISIEKTEGGIRLFVHIADVSHYVPMGSYLDQEAALRGTSVYFPDAVLPMFPERLSNGICSLNPDEDRLAMTVEMNFDSNGGRLGYKIYESVIRSDARMTYTAVREICVDKNPDTLKRYSFLLPQLGWMESLAMILRGNRLARGSLDFDLPESEIIVSLTGETMDIIREERNIAHQIIEEFMLAANETVAQHMTALGIPFLYRIHDAPEATRILEFKELIQTFGLSLQGSDRAMAFSSVLEQVKGRPEERLVHQTLLRSMKQARYSAENRGHFGLASHAYTHFTSPIRRYPDLIVHRLIKEAPRMTAMEREAWTRRLPEIARHASERERVAMEAEREVIKRKKVKFMEDKVGETFHGFITGVEAYGFFVEIEAYFIEGLVHVSTLTDDYYVYNEKQHALMGRRRRGIFRLGDPVSVRVERVDLEGIQIDFGLVPLTKSQNKH